MNMPTVSNSRPPRKQLSDQLDRLDTILEALSDGLNGAVADAAREGTRLAVKDAVVEILTDPNLRAKLRQAAAPDPVEEPASAARSSSFWSRLKAKASQSAEAVRGAAANLVDGSIRGIRSVVS